MVLNLQWSGKQTLSTKFRRLYWTKEKLEYFDAEISKAKNPEKHRADGAYNCVCAKVEEEKGMG